MNRSTLWDYSTAILRLVRLGSLAEGSIRMSSLHSLKVVY